MDKLSDDFQSFHADRVQSCMKNVLNEYSLGKRDFDKYDIDDNYEEFKELVLDDAVFIRCFVEACFMKCSFKNAKFVACNLKTITFINCDLTNVFVDDCSIESIDLTGSVVEGIKFGTNYAYGNTLINEY